MRSLTVTMVLGAVLMGATACGGGGTTGDNPPAPEAGGDAAGDPETAAPDAQDPPRDAGPGEGGMGLGDASDASQDAPGEASDSGGADSGNAADAGLDSMGSPEAATCSPFECTVCTMVAFACPKPGYVGGFACGPTCAPLQAQCPTWYTESDAAWNGCDAYMTGDGPIWCCPQ